MKQETNKEIDLLLRRLNRRDGEAARDAETQIDERHLDADELSSYAQNVLPPAARTRYTEHLAECSTCRLLATELSLALGVTTAAAPVETVPASSGLKRFLSSLLSPMVLRYAVPALGVIVVMVVGFVVMRNREAREAMMAQVDGRSGQAPSSSRYQEPPATPAPLADQPESTKEQQPANARPDKDTSGPRETAAEKPAKGEAPAGTADLAGAAPAPVPTPGDTTAFTPRAVNSLPVQSPVAPKSVSGFDSPDTKKEQEGKRQPEPVAQTAAAQGAKEKQQANEPARESLPPAARNVTIDGVSQDKDQNKAQTAPSTGGGVGGGARATTRRRAEESKDDAETRSVAGRKFRKDRGIWTDTAYHSSTRTVNMARGSEQFRGLVADEPAIGTIAEQLDGEVIVVWKGRAYRIR